MDYYEQRVTAVKPLGDYRLRVSFEDEFTGEIDLAPLLDCGPVFQPLRDKDFFARVGDVRSPRRMTTAIGPSISRPGSPAPSASGSKPAAVTSAVITIASLEHALDSIEDRLRERETGLTQSRRQIVDLTHQLDQPFEHEEKLAAATKCQQEIISALDITKNQASAAVGEGTEQGETVTVKTTSQNQRCAKRAAVLAR